jgi:hypothetical protein
MNYQIQIERKQLNAGGKKRYGLSWFRLGLQDSEFRIKHKTSTLRMHEGASNMVVVNVRTTNNIDECLLGPWYKYNIYLIGVINKRQRLGPNNLLGDELAITLYEP